MKFAVKTILPVLCTLILFGCSATRYVPIGESLLSNNKVVIEETNRGDVDKSELEDYIQQRPNRRLFGLGVYLALYNMTDTSKHTGWHKFWAEKVGEAPVVLDSSKIEHSKSLMSIYLESMGFLNATITDSIAISDKRKATVTYTIDAQEPFSIGKITYTINDDFIAPIIAEDTVNSLLQSGGRFERKTLEAERLRITDMLRNRGFWSFNQNFVTYRADSTWGNSTVNLELILSQATVGQDENGRQIISNHPIYRINDITMNSNYDPTLTSPVYDSLSYRGVDILYRDELLILEKYLVEQLGMSPGEVYNHLSIEQTYDNVRSLGFTPQIIFSPVAVDSSDIIYVTSLSSDAITTQRELNCLIQCTPIVRQNFQVDFEATTTSSYFSLGLGLGYQNHNLFRGAEDFMISARGAYEFGWGGNSRNSFEFGMSASLSVPRFWLPISSDITRSLSYSATKMSLSFNTQRRPGYDRTIYSAVYGYGWTLKNGARFTVNPADVNIVDVPWVDSTFLEGITNPYLRNSYESQLIAGLSASYYYTTNSDPKVSGSSLRITGDVNGNLFYGLSSLFGAQRHTSSAGDSYYNLFGLRYAQYARLMAEYSSRFNFGSRSQIAWRFLIGAGVAYGNSQVIPFERQYFAGGGNSMRGWQVRSLGPGSVLYDNNESFPNQLGDFRLEANFEYRVNVVGGFNLGLFVDCGNIWMNGSGEDRESAKFEFNDFYKELALNTGIGIRYDVGFFLLRLDWGIKLYNPNLLDQQRWFSQLKLDQTALHFAIGMPF